MRNRYKRLLLLMKKEKRACPPTEQNARLFRHKLLLLLYLSRLPNIFQILTPYLKKVVPRKILTKLRPTL